MGGRWTDGGWWEDGRADGWSEGRTEDSQVVRRSEPVSPQTAGTASTEGPCGERTLHARCESVGRHLLSFQDASDRNWDFLTLTHRHVYSRQNGCGRGSSTTVYCDELTALNLLLL